MVTLGATGEEIVDYLLGLEALLLITSTRVMVVREGADFRLRNGVTSWPFGMLRDVELTPPRQLSGRVVLRFGTYPWQAVSLFISATEWAAVERVVSKMQVLAARARPSHLPDMSSDGAGPRADPLRVRSMTALIGASSRDELTTTISAAGISNREQSGIPEG